jgi:hypothetical protein
MTLGAMRAQNGGASLMSASGARALGTLSPVGWLPSADRYGPV